MSRSTKISDLRNDVLSMHTDDCRQELADTLDILDELESDFEVLVREVLAIRQEQGKDILDGSHPFYSMAQCRRIFIQ